MNIPILTGLFVAGLAASPPALAADPSPDLHGLSVSIEIRATDDQQRPPVPLEVVLTLIARDGCAEASERRRDAEYDFKVCSEGELAGSAALSFQLERTRHVADGSEKRQFKVKANLAPGKPIVIARFVEGAREMEVKATARKT